MQIVEGMIVCSDAGRDCGRFCVVLQRQGDRVWIADGRHHLIDKPKCKNVKHLNPTDQIVDLTVCCTNKKLREACRPYQEAAAHPKSPKGGSTLVQG